MSESPLNDIRIGEISHRWAQSQGLESHYAPQLASTNDSAKTEAFGADGEHGLKLYLCDHQTAGRGRGRNTWVTSSEGAALLSSWSYALQDPPQPTFTAKAGLALFRAAQATWPFLDWALKAPNDLYVGDKKIAGLLVETLSQGQDVRLIVGLGLNVMSHPESLDQATSLFESLPDGGVLLGEDWIGFLERFLFELTDAVARSTDPLTPTDALALKRALNLRPTQKPLIDEVLEDGSLRSGSQVKPWMEI